MTGLARAHRILLGAVAVVAAVLAVTGVWLTFTYRPSAAQAWTDLDIAPAGTDWPRLIHQVATALLVLLVIALLVVGVVATRRWRSATALLVTTIALAYTGLLLPWDQVALWAVTVGTNYQGMLSAAFSDDVRFVLIRGVEISQGTLRLWFLVHAVALALIFFSLLALTARSAYRRSPAATSPPPTSGDRWSNQSMTARS
ncbi:hypothetical protein BH24ACT1_BH24ACT1_08280 [soil metagenome]